MKIEGEDAKRYTAVRLDDLTSVEGSGNLVMADDVSGEVRWVDKTGKPCTASLGMRSIKLVRRAR